MCCPRRRSDDRSIPYILEPQARPKGHRAWSVTTLRRVPAARLGLGESMPVPLRYSRIMVKIDSRTPSVPSSAIHGSASSTSCWVRVKWDRRIRRNCSRASHAFAWRSSEAISGSLASSCAIWSMRIWSTSAGGSVCDFDQYTISSSPSLGRRSARTSTSSGPPGWTNPYEATNSSLLLAP